MQDAVSIFCNLSVCHSREWRRERMLDLEARHTLKPCRSSIRTKALEPALPYVEPPSRCCAVCAHHENVLSITHATLGRAGLSDRHTILVALSNLAGSLCAQLFVGRPCDLLSPKHNGAQILDCRVPWSRYFNISWVDDRTVASDARPVLGDGVWQRRNRSVIRLNTSGAAHYTVLATQYLQAVKLRNDQQTRFAWMWDIRDGPPLPALRHALVTRLVVADLLGGQLLPNLWGEAKRKRTGKWALYVDNESHASHACVYARLPVSATVQLMARRFMATHRLEPRTFLSVHLRRGDASDQCDSSIGHVIRWLQCSPFWSGPAESSRAKLASKLTRAHPELLLFTDETDPSYLRSLARELQGMHLNESREVSTSAAQQQANTSEETLTLP